MSEILCPKCHKPISAADQAAFCPFCGEKLKKEGPDLSAVLAEPDPKKRYEALVALRETHPGSMEIAEELLLLGRLYERGKRGVDFTIIKCYVLNVYLEPDALKKDKREALRREIFDHPDLTACLALTDDPDAFLRRYLSRLSEEYIRLFLKGSTQHMHTFFGFTNHSKAAKYLASPAAAMLRAMLQDGSLTDAQRSMLSQAFYGAFASQMNGNTQYLDELIEKYNLPFETK